MNNKEVEPLSDWVVKASKLHESYDTIDSLWHDCDILFGTKNFSITFLGNNRFLVVEPIYITKKDSFHGNRDAVVFIRQLNDTFHKVNLQEMVVQLAEVLAEYVSAKKLIKDVLDNVEPDELEDLYERVIVKKGKVKEEEGCYKLLIGGKRGSPFELMLRD